ncbi:NACHT domain-containing protein [Pseudomonas multiresinivorans]|uniref:NACHT domain-containing protein n=1 Tax=Pseudomonas multiresinivorans TaxID=95301 RepID=A0A7Z3BPV9_9PSED|nr:NACHT domain-containing protein [Pseudomonas multiresinivorans]QJP10709.1 NACHT domain-containing protein [Pseudomonas multiresinivorans]
MTGILETISLESAIKLSLPTAKKIFSSKIQPLIETTLTSYFKNKSAIKSFEENSIDYLSNLGGQCSIINTIAFQNTPKRLDDLYIPLTLTTPEKTISIKITENSDLFKIGNRILINDSAGMGKSTLSKRVVLNTLSTNTEIPVYLELRKVNKTTILESIKKRLGIKNETSSEILKELPLQFIFDGLDEVPSDLKQSTTEDLRSFINFIGDSANILITSRNEAYLSEFYDFIHLSIKPLKREEAYDLIKKYDPSDEISRPLIEGIQQAGASIREFLSTPLYVSLLFCSYRFKSAIPQKKNLFYSQVYDALFESHDLSKEASFVRTKNCTLDSTDFHSVLRRLGFWCLSSNGKIEFQKDELEIIVSKIIGSMNGINCNPSSFTLDLVTTVPLFVREGPILRWSHKSLMEYFAAMFICSDTKSKQEEILLKLYNSDLSESYKNVFELCSDIDYTTFRSSIVKQLLTETLDHYKILLEEFTPQDIPLDEIKKRAGITAYQNIGFALLREFNPENSKKVWSNKKYTTPYLEAFPKSQKYTEMVAHLTAKTPSAGVYFIYNTTKHITTLRILSEKSPNTVTSEDKKTSQIAKEIRKSPTLKNGTFYVINNQKDSPCNSKENFSIVNKIIRLGSIYMISIDAAKEELDSISSDSSNGIEDLLNNL